MTCDDVGTRRVRQCSLDFFICAKTSCKGVGEYKILCVLCFGIHSYFRYQTRNLNSDFNTPVINSVSLCSPIVLWSKEMSKLTDFNLLIAIGHCNFNLDFNTHPSSLAKVPIR